MELFDDGGKRWRRSIVGTMERREKRRRVWMVENVLLELLLAIFEVGIFGS